MSTHPRPNLTPAPRRGNRALPAVLALIILAVPWMIAATCPFIHPDDPEYFSRNPHVLTGITLANVRWAFSNVDVHLYHPLTWLSLMLDATLWGTGPVGCHITNILLHVASTLLLFHFLRTTTGGVGRAFLVAALFSIHPLRVESVAWVTERKDVLSIFLGMLTLCAYARYAMSSRPRWYLAALLLAAASLLAKATLITLPALLLLLDIWPLNRLANCRWPRLLLEKIPFALLSAAMIVVTALALKYTHTDISHMIPLAQRLANALLSCALYLRDTFYFGGLSLFYPYRAVPAEDTLLAGGLLILLTAVAVWAAFKFPRQGRPALIGWLWFLGTLTPALGLIQSGQQSRADRFTYFPSIGLFIALVWPWPGRLFVKPTRARLRNLAIGFILCLLAGYTSLQLILWRNPLTLYLAGIDHTKNNWYLLGRAGDACRQLGAYDRAEGYYRQALALQPDDGPNHNNYASLLALLHRDAEALAEFRRAHEYAPYEAEIQANYERALRQLQP
jgi:tetratricopeptide (TPR) repeat protein